MSEESLSGFLERAWSHLLRGKADRHHPARHPTLATIGPDGPEARTLVLRAVSQSASTLEFHTDGASPKTDHIATDPRVAIHVWIPKSQLQIRAQARVEFRPGDPDLFAQLPAHAQENYRGAVPGTPISTDIQKTKPRFSRLICHLTKFDLLLLSDPHQRAIYTSETDWSGTWITA
ncbi:pyridoxamine 5'-phosphate oxidase family protein [Gymnodinialimonas sp. 2305UL16-5]|uniref:pyridoxamine 5'-phosphate oxidase family protein n=1 Tax=Gymnodinialimonas mytili TaxID=3126503 RepID=UPI00309ED796